MAGGSKLLIDTDPGTDDAIALLMALEAASRAEIELLGIATVGGNAAAARTTRNTLAILEYAGRADVPVAMGASRPLTGSFPYAYSFHGPSGLTVRLPAPRTQPCQETAVEFLAHKLLASPERVTLVALGPLTNVATLLKVHPEVGPRLSRLVVMGGAIAVPGNVTPHAEFNFYSDPLAASMVLCHGVAVTLVDLAVCRRASLGREALAPLLKGGRSARLAGRILSNWFRGHPDKDSYDLCDPLALAISMQPEILATRPGRVEVHTGCTERLGETTLKGAYGNVEVASEVNVQRFFELFYRLLT